jgi:hypothetical protein
MTYYIAPGSGGSGTPGGTDTQVQFNDGGAFGGDSGLVFNKTTNKLTTGGDIELNDGGSFTTTLQTVTPTANRTLSFPDATGTLALVGGSSTQVLYNASGALAGISTLTFDGTTLTTAGRFVNSYTSLASSPAKAFTGSWFTGGSATTTKPHLLIEPAGTTSTAWSTGGTGFGVNAASGFAGNLLDLQTNGTSQFRYSESALRFTIKNTGATPVCQFTAFGSSSCQLSVSSAFQIDSGANALTLTTTAGLFLNGIYANIGSGSQDDARIYRDAADTLAQRRTTNAQTFRCYGTFTDASNYVRASLSSSSTAVTLAAETAGTGADDVPLSLTAAGAGTVKVNSVAEVAVSSTVAGLPAAPAVGMLTRVTDASAPAVGSTVAGGGAAAALVWYNGAAWKVIGV